MSGDCPDCDLSVVMTDGTLFCAIWEQQVHGYQSCNYWQCDSSLFQQTNEEEIELDEEEDYYR